MLKLLKAVQTYFELEHLEIFLMSVHVVENFWESLIYMRKGVVLLGYTGRLTSIFTDPELTNKLDNVKDLVSINDLVYITEADSAAQV